MQKVNIAPKKSRTRLVTIGDFEVETRGLATGFWTDLYHRSMTVSWPVFFASAALIFIILNAGFAALYMLGDQPVANVSDELPLSLFYFSIETLATVGYGDMHPQTNYGHLVATVEIFTGMSFLAVMTGLIFARFSRPKARFVFAKYPVVAKRQGQPMLMIRIANARHNTISQATARLWLVREERMAEGDTVRRFYELLLDRNEHPVFSLSWTLFHAIDETSPLYRMDQEELAAADATLVLNVGGVDDSSAQRLFARKVYPQEDIRWQYRYVDITGESPEGRLLLDYTKFHDVTPEND
ncbi:MAG: ion channel [Xanthobacteraceae bacterium]